MMGVGKAVLVAVGGNQIIVGVTVAVGGTGVLVNVGITEGAAAHAEHKQIKILKTKYFFIR